MKLRIIFPGLLCCILLSVASCRMNVLKGEGKKTTVTCQVSPFDNINSNIPVKLVVTVQSGAQQSVQVNGYENVAKHIKTETNGSTLKIYTDLDKTWRIEDDDEITVNITTPLLTALTISGSSDADIHGNLSGNQFKLSVSGAADIVIDSVNLTDFYSDVTGAGDVEINGGHVQTAHYVITGAGDVKAYKLRSSATSAEITGAGDCQVNADEKLYAHISGAGSVSYKGHPAISQNITGAGDLKDAN